MLIARMEPQESERVFAHYIGGLTFLGKSDVHFDFATDAARAFAVSLGEGMKHFNGWDPTEKTFEEAVREAMSDAFKVPEFLEELLAIGKRAFDLDRHDPEKAVIPFDEAVRVKLLADVFFVKQSRRAAASISRTELDAVEGEG